MRHEVHNGVAAMLGVGVGIQAGQHCRAVFDPHAEVERPALGAVPIPTPELGQAYALLGFRDRCADRDGDFVPELVGVGELFVFPI